MDENAANAAPAAAAPNERPTSLVTVDEDFKMLDRIVSELKMEKSSTASDVIKEHEYQVQLVNKRRNAVIRQKKTYEMNGHKFQPKVFSQPTMCTFCSEFIWYFYSVPYSFFFSFYLLEFI